MHGLTVRFHLRLSEGHHVLYTRRRRLRFGLCLRRRHRRHKRVAAAAAPRPLLLRANIDQSRICGGKYQWTYRARKINGRLADENLRYYQMVEAARKMHDQSSAEEWVTDTQRRRPFRRDRIFLVVLE